MLVNADKLSFLLYIRDDVVDGDFSSRACGRRDCDGLDCVVLRRCNAFQRAHIRKLRIGDDDADGLGRVHGGSAADRDDGIRTGLLECLYSVLDIFDGRIRLDVRIQGVLDPLLLKQIRDLSSDAELHKVRVRCNEDLLEAFLLRDPRDLCDSALAMIRNRIQDKSVRHNYFLLS